MVPKAVGAISPCARSAFTRSKMLVHSVAGKRGLWPLRAPAQVARYGWIAHTAFDGCQLVTKPDTFFGQGYQAGNRRGQDGVE